MRIAISRAGTSRRSFQLLCSVLALGITHAGAAEDSDALTIYSSAAPGGIPAEYYRPIPGQTQHPSQFLHLPGYAVVRHERDLTLEQGRSELRFMDVAAFIDPTTVTFSSLTDPEGPRVVEQNFQFDLVSTEKLMQRYIDRQVTVEQTSGDDVRSFEGKLLSTSGGIILQNENGEVTTLNGYTNVRLPELPGGLITRPTLVWDISAKRGGKHRTRVAYETAGMTWWADYNLTFHPERDPNRGKLDVGAWVSIINQSGATYRDAKLKLIAGDVQRAPKAPAPVMRRNMMAESADAMGGFEERAFFEYHLYTLQRPTTLPDNSTKQIELFPAAEGVPAEKIMLYYGLANSFGIFPDPITDRNFGTQSNKNVDVYLRFDNEEKSGLGIPLPRGRIRVSQIDDADGSLEFIGEDTIDHTPRDERVLIRLGSAFDVVGERRQTDYRLDTSGKRIEEQIEIELRNHKDEAVTVIVKENLYRWVQWSITAHSDEYEKIDSRTIHFPVRVPARGSKQVSYTVRYTW